MFYMRRMTCSIRGEPDVLYMRTMTCSISGEPDVLYEENDMFNMR